MRITPLDVRKQEFKRGMRGYDGDEVRAFLSNLADEYEAVLVDNKQLRERLVEQDEKLSEYRNLEQTLRDTLMTAEKLAQEARDTARREGEVLLAEARQRVDQVLADGRGRLDELRREALAVHREKEAYLGRFRSFAEAGIQFVDQHKGDFKDLDGRMLDKLDLTAGQAAPMAAASLDHGVSGAESGSAPAAPRQHERDEWREYAIAEGEADQDQAAEGTAAEIAGVVKAAEAAAEPAPEAGSEASTEPRQEETPQN